jgi:hypothetical protein
MLDLIQNHMLPLVAIGYSIALATIPIGRSPYGGFVQKGFRDGSSTALTLPRHGKAITETSILCDA